MSKTPIKTKNPHPVARMRVCSYAAMIYEQTLAAKPPQGKPLK
jgi:hypothetical protein